MVLICSLNISFIYRLGIGKSNKAKVSLVNFFKGESITLFSAARAERTCESTRLSVRFGARGHAMEVEMFSTSMACPRAPKHTERLMHAFSCACFYKFAPPARAKLV